MSCKIDNICSEMCTAQCSPTAGRWNQDTLHDCNVVQAWQQHHDVIKQSLNTSILLLQQMRPRQRRPQSELLQQAVAAHGSKASGAFLQQARMPLVDLPRQLSDCTLRAANAAKHAVKLEACSQEQLQDLQHCCLHTLQRAAELRAQDVAINKQGHSVKSHAQIVRLCEHALAFAVCGEGMHAENQLLQIAADSLHLDLSVQQAEALQEMLQLRVFVPLGILQMLCNCWQERPS